MNTKIRASIFLDEMERSMESRKSLMIGRSLALSMAVTVRSWMPRSMVSDCPIITGSLVSRMTASLAAISCIPLHTLKSPETTMASTPSLTSSMARFSSSISCQACR